MAVTETRVVGGRVVVVVVVVVVVGSNVVVVVVVVGGCVVVVVVVLVAGVVLLVYAGGLLLGRGLGLLELETAGGRGRVTKPGSVVACQMALGAVCAGVHALTMALLANSIVVSPSATGGGKAQFLCGYV
jgi:hypothetical protein